MVEAANMNESNEVNLHLNNAFPPLHSLPMVNGDATESQATLLMLLSNCGELSSEDLAMKLKAVINENSDLKETIMQNNLAIKHQLQILEKWREQVRSEKTQTKQLISEAHSEIATLHKENQLIRNVLLTSKDGVDCGTLEELRKTMDSSKGENEKLHGELQKSKEENEVMLAEKSKLLGDNTLLKCSLQASKTEIEKLLAQRSDYIRTIKDLRTAMEDEDRARISHRTLQCAISANVLEGERQRLSALDEHFKSDTNINPAEHLDEAAREERRQLHEVKEEVQRLREANDKLHYDDQYYQAKMNSVCQLRDEATAKLLSYEELLAAKSDEIARLKKDLGKTKAQLCEIHSQSDTIAVLRAQVEVYQGDFRAEREAREALAAERDNLREELSRLHNSNANRVDEIQSYQRHLLPQRTGRSASEEPESCDVPKPDWTWEKLSVASDALKEEDEKKSREEYEMSCPMCNKEFRELHLLEQHANQCLDGI